MPERVLWSNNEIAVVAVGFTFGDKNVETVCVYRIYEQTGEGNWAEHPENNGEILDAKRARELGLKVEIPSPVYKKGIIVSAKAFGAIAQKMSQGAIFCLPFKEWHYSPISLPDGVEVEIVDEGRHYRAKAKIDSRKIYYLYGYLKADSLEWHQLSLENRNKIPKNIIEQAWSLQTEYNETSREHWKNFKEKQDDEDRKRLMKKFGITE